jgi:class 3 adenylate cyclase
MNNETNSLMGDTMNTASRMSTTCAAGDIQLSAATYTQVCYAMNCPI